MQLFSVFALSLALSIAFVHAFPGHLGSLGSLAGPVGGTGAARGGLGGLTSILGAIPILGSLAGHVGGTDEKVGDCKIDTLDDWIDCLVIAHKSGATNVFEVDKPETADADIKPVAGAAGAGVST